MLLNDADIKHLDSSKPINGYNMDPCNSDVQQNEKENFKAFNDDKIVNIIKREGTQMR